MKFLFVFFRWVVSLTLTFYFTIGQSQQVFTPVDAPSEKIKTATRALHSVDFFQVDKRLFHQTLNQGGTFELTLPQKQGDKILILEKTNILSPDYRLFTGSGNSFSTASDYAFYRGHVQNARNSSVSLTYFRGQFSLMVSDKDGTYEIHPDGNVYAGYYDRDQKESWDKDWTCAVLDAENGKTPLDEGNVRNVAEPSCVTVFLEIDQKMYQKKGSDVAATEAWALTVMNQVAIFFMEYDVPLNISGIQVWDTPDPYISATNTSEALNLFRNAVHDNPNFNGRLAHLLSGRSLGGGIAYLNSLCSTFTNVAVSANLNGNSSPYPSYSWNVFVIAHELGHNFGSPHTQNCSWNGNNTAIDGCGNIEGSCPDPGNPVDGGTIMSYCHLTSSGINFNKGFGPQPGNLIKDKYLTATCETGTECAYVPPFNDVCSRAKEIPVLNYCVNGLFSNYATTPSGDGGPMSCGQSGTENDLWFSFEYPSVDTVTIEVQGTEIISDVVVEVYSGDCSNLSSVVCGYSENGNLLSLNLSDSLLINEVLYLRVVEQNSDEEGTFSLCIYSNDLPCETAVVDTLITLYNAWVGSNWTNAQGWTDGAVNGACDYCNWYGIECNYLGEIIAMRLPNNNLQGNLPTALTSMIHLKEIDLHNNLLTDTLPNYWDSLAVLFVLDLRENNFTGSIPISFTTMDKINRIHLDHNSLTNEMPSGLGYNASLRTFTASNNLLNGCFVPGISSFCTKDSINLINNPDLPYAGDVTLLCEEGWGTDWDNDGFCNEVEDCDDFNDMVNPDAEEVICDAIDNNCDGTIDEGSDFGPNVWIGPDTLGVFNDPTNWSLGHVPKICENVEIGLSGENIDLVLMGNGEGQEGGFGNLQIRDLHIGEASTVHLLDNVSANLLGNGVLVNNGSLYISGYLNIRDQNDTQNTAMTNYGIIEVVNFGGFSIQEMGDVGLLNAPGGIIELDGYSNIDAFTSSAAKNALVNEGTIKLTGNLTIYGPYDEEVIKNLPNAVFEIKSGAFLFVNE